MDAFWNLITVPMLNLLLLLYEFLGHNFALSIAVFTIIVRVVTLPLTLPQQRSAKAMQALQPRIQELQKKYKNDREKLAQAQMELYKEAGVNPLGGCLPMLVQLPIWIGLYQAVLRGLGNSPLQLFQLSQSILPGLQWLSDLVPLNARFLWMDLAHTADFGGGQHLHSAENDRHTPHRYPDGLIQSVDDADDAIHVRVLQPAVCIRPLALLGS